MTNGTKEIRSVRSLSRAADTWGVMGGGGPGRVGSQTAGLSGGFPATTALRVRGFRDPPVRQQRRDRMPEPQNLPTEPSAGAALLTSGSGLPRCLAPAAPESKRAPKCVLCDRWWGTCGQTAPGARRPPTPGCAEQVVSLPRVAAGSERL